MALTKKELINQLLPELNKAFKYSLRYGQMHRTTPVTQTKVDAHKYETEAKDLPIEVCQNMWLAKYGNEPVSMVEIQNQEKLIWEIGNRLYWAGIFEHDLTMDEYACKS